MQPITDLHSFSAFVNNRWDNDPRCERDKLMIAALGIGGEAGEVTEPIKKWAYSGKPISQRAMMLELGDLLHYLVRIAYVFGIPLEQVIQENVDKLRDRLPEGHAPVPADGSLRVAP